MPSIARVTGIAVITIGSIIILGAVGVFLYQLSHRFAHTNYRYATTVLGDMLLVGLPLGLGAIVLVAGVWLLKHKSGST